MLKNTTIKEIRFSCILFCSILAIGASCKKNNDAASANPQLKNTVWSGEFYYTTGNYKGLQGFSIQLNADSTATWSDFYSTRSAGVWRVQSNTVTITFADKSTVSATVSPDKWTNFSGTPSNTFQIDNVSLSATVQQSVITNSTWSGTMDGTAVKIKFLDAGKISFTSGMDAPVTTSYSIGGSGIRFNYETGFFKDWAGHFAVFENNNTLLKGFEQYNSYAPGLIGTSYHTWNAKKQ